MSSDQRDPELRIALGERVNCTLVNGVETWGYLRSFKRTDGTWAVWTHRDGAADASQVRRL